MTRGEWVAISGAVVLSVSLLAIPWFAITVDGFVQPGSGGAAFELLAGHDVVLLLAALTPLVVPALRAGPLGVRLGDGASRLTAVAGLVAALVTLYVMVAPPEPDVLISGALESSADVGLTPRAGAFIGQAASLAILAGGAIEMASAAAARQRRMPRPQVPETSRSAVQTAPAKPPAKTTGSTTAKPSRAETRRPARKPAAVKKAVRPAAPKATKKAPRKSPARKPAATKERKPPAKVGLAAASEAQLRELGLTATQARRVLRYRDVLGKVSGVGDLEAVPGLPKATVAELRAKLRD